jgi:hypothetical protein
VIRAEKAAECRDFTQSCPSAETQKDRTARFSERDYRTDSYTPIQDGKSPHNEGYAGEDVSSFGISVQDE